MKDIIITAFFSFFFGWNLNDFITKKIAENKEQE